jgi:hypothetical protein
LGLSTSVQGREQLSTRMYIGTAGSWRRHLSATLTPRSRDHADFDAFFRPQRRRMCRHCSARQGKPSTTERARRDVLSGQLASLYAFYGIETSEA